MLLLLQLILPQEWNAGDAGYRVMSFEKEYGELIGDRLWIADNGFTIENNGEYFVSNWGTDITGMILNATVGMDDPSAEDQISIYPNPVHSDFI